MHSFATRDIEKRIGQATRNGYIKRNLNVFFLYKRAYSNVAQAWMEQHHPELAKTQPPIVSLVGESWAKESATFKGSYTIYSELEKAGLRDAFPDYKYRPGAKKASGITKSSTRGVGGSARSRARTSQPVPPRTQTPPCSSSEASTSVGRHSRFHTPLESTPLPVTPQPYQYRSAVSTPFYDDDGDEINGLQVYYDTPSSHYGASPSPYVAYDGSLLGPTPERHLSAPSAFEEAMARSVSPQPNGLMSLPVDPVMSVVPGARGYMPSPARSVDAGYTVTWEQVHSSTPEYEPAGTSVPASHPYHESQRSSHLDSIADSMLSSVPMGAERCGFAADEHAWRMDTPAQDEAMRKFTFALDDWSN